MMKIKKGDIYYANLNPSFGSEQGGIRPVVIIQNNKGNKYAPTVIVAALTSGNHKKHYFTYAFFIKGKRWLERRINHFVRTSKNY